MAPKVKKRGAPKVRRRLVHCAACGASLERRLSDIKRNTSRRFFCNEACLRRVGVRPRTGTEKPCEQCGKPIYTVPSATKPARFCSKQCVHAWNGRAAEHRTCERCGKPYRVSPSQASIRAARFCSRRCEGDSRIQRPLERRHNGRCARLDRFGYVLIYEPDHPKAVGGGWVYEHRWLVEQDLGRVLDQNETVHHINGVKDDNRLENLIVMGAREHAALSVREYRDATNGKLRELDEYKRRFGPLKKES